MCIRCEVELSKDGPSDEDFQHLLARITQKSLSGLFGAFALLPVCTRDRKYRISGGSDVSCPPKRGLLTMEEAREEDYTPFTFLCKQFIPPIKTI